MWPVNFVDYNSYQNNKLMSKAVFAILFTLMVTSMAITMEEAKNRIGKDQCAVKIMDLYEDEINAKIVELKKVHFPLI